MKMMASLLLAFVASTLSPASQALDPIDPPKVSCGDKQPLYDPDQQQVAAINSNTYTPGSLLGTLQFLHGFPVAFAGSGDPCLGPIPVYMVSRHDAPARDTHAMARRLAPELAEFSKRTGEEACARMCRTPEGAIVAQVVTLHAHVVCLAEENTCPAGSLPTPETIHSHPPHTAFMANAVDALGWEEPGIVGKLTLTGYPDSLSPNDRKQAPVWLVGTRAQLIWLATPDGAEVERP